MNPPDVAHPTFTPNVGNSIFPGYNDCGGILLCGYEWGWSKRDQARLESNGPGLNILDAKHTFSDKSPRFGPQAMTWRYDARVVRWFGLWGHPLSRSGLGGPLEQSIMQTNWCNTQANRIEGDCFRKLTCPEQIRNFLDHLAFFRPRLVLLLGSVMIRALQDKSVMPGVADRLGGCLGPPDRMQKDHPGVRFWVSIQRFRETTVICLPHPSSSRGLRDDYIARFADEIGPLIAGVVQNKETAVERKTRC